MNVEGTAAMVTGGASGLGEAAARLLAERGARVIVLDLQDEKGSQVASEIGGIYTRADVTSEAEVIQAVDAARKLGPLRVLVNCAGVGSARRTIGRGGDYKEAFSLNEFTRVIAVNLIGSFNCVRLAASAMSLNAPLEDGQRGVIVNTSSGAAFDGQIGQAAYSASKAGIVGLTLPVARDLAAVGIRVNTISPGLFETPIYGTGDEATKLKENLTKNALFPHRFGEPREFAHLVIEMVTNGYMNAETIRIDGGTRLPPR